MLFMMMDNKGLNGSDSFLLMGQYAVANNKTLIQLCCFSVLLICILSSALAYGD